MLRFVGPGKNGQTIVGLGLSEGNIKHLKAGQPMYFSLDELGLEGIDVMIVYGETEHAIRDDLKKHGMNFRKEIEQ